MTYEKKAMTAFAQATVAACDLIEARFANTSFTGAVARVVKIEAPFVESTGGGRQARESIVLKAANDDAAHNVTAGFVDVGLRSCELRSYDALNLLFRQRFGRALDLYQSEYDRFAAELRELLEKEGSRWSRPTSNAPRPTPWPRRAPMPASWWRWAWWPPSWSSASRW